MDFSKLMSGAASAVTRAVQYTEEKLFHAEKTEYDAHVENLMHRADLCQQLTEKIVANTEAFLQPNPALRVESFVYDKLDRKKPERSTPEIELGSVLLSAGNETGPATPYGNALIKLGMAETEIGRANQDFGQDAASKFIGPLRRYLEEMKTAQKERRTLEAKRLDLDACRTRLKRVSTEAAKRAVENDLKAAQTAFDQQLELTKLLLENIVTAQASHVHYLSDFIAAQAAFYTRSLVTVKDLQNQLGSFRSLSENNS